MSLQWVCAFLFGMTVLDLKACQTPLALYYFINLCFFCFVLFFKSFAFFTGEFLLQKWCYNGLYEKCPQLGVEMEGSFIFALQHLLLWCLCVAALECKRIKIHKNDRFAGLISGTIMWVITLLKAQAWSWWFTNLSVNVIIIGISWTSVGTCS